MMLDINRHWSLICEENSCEFYPLPYILLYFLIGFELTLGWMQFSVTISYHSDNDIKLMEELKSRNV